MEGAVLSPGTCLDDYHVIACLSKTKHSEVFIGTDNVHSERLVVIKLSCDSTLIENELAVIPQTHHPAIPVLIKSGTLQDVASYARYLVIPYSGRFDILSYVKSGDKQFVTADCLILLEQLANALEYLHSRGILHCDVKPENTTVDDFGNLHLIDFGAARLPHSDGPLRSTYGFYPPSYNNEANQILSKFIDFSIDDYGFYKTSQLMLAAIGIDEVSIEEFQRFAPRVDYVYINRILDRLKTPQMKAAQSSSRKRAAAFVLVILLIITVRMQNNKRVDLVTLNVANQQQSVLKTTPPTSEELRTSEIFKSLQNEIRSENYEEVHRKCLALSVDYTNDHGIASMWICAQLEMLIAGHEFDIVIDPCQAVKNAGSAVKSEIQFDAYLLYELQSKEQDFTKANIDQIFEAFDRTKLVNTRWKNYRRRQIYQVFCVT